MKKIIFSALTSALLLEAAPLGLATHTELGYIKNTGNTVSETFVLDFNLKKEWEKHIVNTKITGQYGSENDVETNNKYLIELTYDYKFTDTFTFNYLVGYKDDKFSTYDYQFYTGPGLKYIAIKSEPQNLDIGANILYAEDKKLSNGKTRDYIAYRFALNYDTQMLENLKFTQELSYRGDVDISENYFAYLKSGLSSKISDYLSAGISYVVDYTNIPDLSKKRADNTLTANLIINY